MTFLRHFAAALMFFSAIVGLVAAIQQPGLAGIVIGVTSVAVLYAIGRSIWPSAVNAYNAVRRHAPLLAERDHLRGDLERYKDRLEEARAQLDDARGAGVEEGKMQFFGAILATSVRPPPKLIAVAMEGSRLVLVARNLGEHPIRAGARFEVRVEGSEAERRGVVEALPGSDEDQDTTRFVCVERTVPAFWDRLEQQANVDAAPPAGVQLVKYDVPLDDVRRRLSPRQSPIRDHNVTDLDEEES